MIFNILTIAKLVLKAYKTYLEALRLTSQTMMATEDVGTTGNEPSPHLPALSETWKRLLNINRDQQYTKHFQEFLKNTYNLIFSSDKIDVRLGKTQQKHTVWPACVADNLSKNATLTIYYITHKNFKYSAYCWSLFIFNNLF